MGKMNKIWAFVLITLCLCLFVTAEKLFEIDVPLKRPALCVGNGRVFIADRGQLNIHAYSLTDLQHISSFGRKGKGPSEFDNFESMSIIDDYLLVRTRGKILFFSLNGEYIKEIRTPLEFRNITPVKNLYFAYKTDINPKLKESSIITFYILDMRFNIKTKIYSGVGEFSGDMRLRTRSYEGVEKRILTPLPHCIWGEYYDEHVIIGDTTKGLKFMVFSLKGDLVKEVEHKYDKTRLSSKYKKGFLNQWKNRQVEVIFPKYYPAFHSFTIFDGFIYVLPHGAEKLNDPEREQRAHTRPTIVMSPSCELIKTIQLPDKWRLKITSYIFQNKFYSLYDFGDDRNLELHVEEIE